MAQHRQDPPPWWHRLVPQRWRPVDAPLDCTGIASQYAMDQVRTRLRDPAWANQAGANNRPGWAAPTRVLPNLSSPLLTDGQKARAANMGRHPI